MFTTIYIEEQIADHPRTRDICARFPQATRVRCERYGEVFNPKAQNFRLQKRKPALILAHKHDRRVLETPAGYGIGGRNNYYFSHMLNCLYKTFGICNSFQRIDRIEEYYVDRNSW